MHATISDMLKNPLFRAQLIALCAVAFVHTAALQFDLYWHFVWLDVLTHFLGGMWVALLALLLFSRIRSQTLGPIATITAAMAVGVGWECFEAAIGSPREANFVFDTTIDLIVDFFGASAGYIIGRARMRTHE